MTFRDINLLAARRQAELRDVIAYTPDTVYGEVSPVWKGMFEARPNFLTPENFNFFRNPSTTAIFGVGGHKDNDHQAKLFDQSIVDLANAQNIPDDVISAIAEPLLGSPEVHPYRGNLFSTAFLGNLARAWRTAQFARKYCSANRPLRVCEIGAGFGAMAQILHQFLDIESYTVIDLPENLYLSSIYLPATLPGRTHQIVDGVKPESLACRHHLNFALPGFTDSLTAHPFDLVLNQASLGEMPLATAQAYVSWIRNRLTDDGIFHFLNRFNVGNANGASRLGDFGLQAFKLLSLGPMERMTRPTNQLHSEVVVSPRQGSDIAAADLDLIGDLFACGFDPQVASLTTAMTGGTTTAETRERLRILSPVFSPSTLQHKRDVLQGINDEFLPEIRAVMRAILDLIGGSDFSREKETVLRYDLGLKLETRLRGLYAEREAAQGTLAWKETLAPLALKSSALAAMCETHVRNGHFSAAYRRELRVIN